MSTPTPTPSATGLPPGVEPWMEFESNAPRFIAVTSIFMAMVLIVIALRIYTRLYIVRVTKIDDWFMVASVAFIFAGFVCICVMASHGLGRYSYWVSRADMVALDRANLINTLLSACCGMMFLKLSIAFQLKRFSMSRWYTWCLYALIALVMIYSIIGPIIFLIYCTPVPRFWDKSVPGTCRPASFIVKWGMFNIACNIFSDVAFAVLPLPIVWNLNMKRKIKVYLIMILSLGYFAVAMGVVKALYMLNYAKEKDQTFEKNIIFWAFLEIATAVIAACAPTLKPLVARNLQVSTKSGSKGFQSRMNRDGTTAHRLGDEPFSKAHRTANRTANHDIEFGTFSRHDNLDDHQGKGAEAYSTVIKGGSGSGSFNIDDKISENSDANRRASHDDDTDFILTDDIRSGGIMRTTQIVVTDTKHH